MLFEEFAPPPDAFQCKSAKVVGVPMALSVHSLWPFYAWFFHDLVSVLRGDEPQYTQPTLGLVADTMLEHVQRLVEFYDQSEDDVVRRFRKHAGWYVAGWPVGKELRRRLHQVSSYDELLLVTEDFDRDVTLPPEGVRVKRSHTGGPRRVALPEGWLDDPDEYPDTGLRKNGALL